MRNPTIIAMAPLGCPPKPVIIAANRAGALGCLSVVGQPLPVLVETLENIGLLDGSPVGLLISRFEPSDLDILLSHSEKLPDLRWILGVEQNHRLAHWAESFARHGISFTAQVSSSEMAREAVQLGADSLILKGSECGGFVGNETTFVLAQRWSKLAKRESLEVPFLLQGGIGLNTVAAAVACGAIGVALDAQWLLARECSLELNFKRQIASADGSEIATIGEKLGFPCQILHRPNSKALAKLADLELSVADEEILSTRHRAWIDGVQSIVAESGDCHFLGQDICLAASLADRYVTVGGIVSALRSEAEKSFRLAAKLNHIDENSPLAQSHGTKFPILQGPMTRVSDTVNFAHAVSDNGGLSFLALAVMRQPEVSRLLEEASDRLSGMPWGVGILGFLPSALRAEQNEIILRHKPPFAIIAGGRPDQALQFEEAGITTYLHVPSPGLLKNFLRQGARRFIFEGRECGGHVGPRSSFVLWQSACDIITDFIDKKPIQDLHLVFAGGIIDEVSASMIAAMTAPLAEKGVKIGLLMGTAYLFTREAVEAGAIVSKFQEQAVSCEDTVLMQTGPGHAIRCIKTPYYDVFESEKQRLLEKGASHDEIVRNLEGMNIGRLRIASKGVDRKEVSQSATRELTVVSDHEQYQRGMYMIGQVAALEDKVITIAHLHQRVCRGGTERLRNIASHFPVAQVIREQAPNEIAIIGMSCYYPDAVTLDEYWQNILNRHYAVKEIPQSHWDWRLFYDADPKSPDRIISKWGGFLKDVKFDPLKYGITPKSMEVIEPLQLLTLEAVDKALHDAGYSKRPFNRERTACIVGIGGGAGPKSVAYGFRTCMRLADYFDDMPILSDRIIEKAGGVLPEWTEDSFPGFLANICSGRVSNRFDLGGPNYAIDAACASSLASLDICVRELEVGNVDMAIAMGADAVQTPLSYMAFSKTHALSQKGHSKPFDASGDGIVLSEGVGVVILKRLEDAKRDGDRVYAVIKGIGSSSDGKAKGLTAPNALGQARALDRAYAKANIHPREVGLFEAHGTGTVVGDKTEAMALSTVLAEDGAAPSSCALGSVKSMIGHTKCAAGIAGVIKAALALHHKVLPPTLVDEPNPSVNFDQSPLYLNASLRPWVEEENKPRIAGVSAFGFGGTNFHAVLSEYKEGLEEESAALRAWPTEVFVWRAEAAGIEKTLRELLPQFSELRSVSLAEWSVAVNREFRGSATGATLAIVAKDSDDLIKKAESFLSRERKDEAYHDPRGIFFQPATPAPGKVAFLFPGQGSQYINMLADLATTFPVVRQSIDRASRVVGGRLPKSLGRFVYPSSAFTPEKEKQSEAELSDTRVAQPALAACNVGLLQLLKQFGIFPDAVAGHSFGEYVACHAAGMFRDEDLFELAYQRGKAIHDQLRAGSTMLAVNSSLERVKNLVMGLDQVYLANVNSPDQTVLSLKLSELEKVKSRFEKEDIRCRELPVACGFHSPFVADAARQLEEALNQVSFQTSTHQVYSNTIGNAYPKDIDEQKQLLVNHLVREVNFDGMIRAMHRDGISTFIETGPSSVLSNLVKGILPDAAVHVFAADQRGTNGLTQLQNLLAQLCAAGYQPDLSLLAKVREMEEKSVRALIAPVSIEESRNVWLVNGVRAKRASDPEPLLLGQPHPSLVKSGGTERIIHARDLSKSIPQSSPSQEPNKGKITPKPKAKPFTAPQTASPSKPSQPMNQSTKEITTTQNGIASKAPSMPPMRPANAEQVMLGFQNLMTQFLETQRAIMLSYLGSDVATSQPLFLSGTLPTAVPRKAIASPAPAPVTSNGTATNGSHSHRNGSNGTNTRPVEEAPTLVNRVEALIEPKKVKAEPTVSVIESPANPPERVLEPTSPVVSTEAIRARLLDIVSTRTGYPQDMLDADLDLEGDLGIDSIKRVEILGELAEFIMPNATTADSENGLDLEKLSGLRTLRQILDYLEEFLDSHAAATPDSKKKITA